MSVVLDETRTAIEHGDGAERGGVRSERGAATGTAPLRSAIEQNIGKYSMLNERSAGQRRYLVCGPDPEDLLPPPSTSRSRRGYSSEKAAGSSSMNSAGADITSLSPSSDVLLARHRA